jgi:hypothetical protein
MTLTPGLRKFALTVHVTLSVSWLGAVAAFLALAIAGLTSQDARVVGAAYLAMELTGWFVIVPLSFASPLTGLVQALGTTWGLFRHYWVLVKFVITIPCTIILLLHMQPTSRLAGVAADTILAGADLRALQVQLVADAVAAVLVLLVATTLALSKPRGMTPYGVRKHREGGGLSQEASTPRWVKVFAGIAIALILMFIILHITGHSLGAIKTPLQKKGVPWARPFWMTNLSADSSSPTRGGPQSS